MALLNLPPVPTSLKPMAHYLKTATEHESRDPVVTYWCRLCALQTGMKLDKKSKEALAVLLPLMDWLEKEKKVLSDNEAVTNEVVASAHIENYAVKLFSWADREDRAAKFNKNVVKAFYTAGMLFDVMSVFGELTPENAHMGKYAKWKAAYIHNCLKNGETPVPGPMTDENEDDSGVTAPPGGWAQPQIPPTDQAQFPQHPPDLPQVPPGLPQVPSKLPEVPPVTNPVQAPVPAAVPASVPTPHEPTAANAMNPAMVAKIQKYCKYASSALDYDDQKTAIQNLEKALALLKTGRE